MLGSERSALSRLHRWQCSHDHDPRVSPWSFDALGMSSLPGNQDCGDQTWPRRGAARDRVAVVESHLQRKLAPQSVPWCSCHLTSGRTLDGRENGVDAGSYRITHEFQIAIYDFLACSAEPLHQDGFLPLRPHRTGRAVNQGYRPRVRCASATRSTATMVAASRRVKCRVAATSSRWRQAASIRTSSRSSTSAALHQ
jgi:hypothetical protein